MELEQRGVTFLEEIWLGFIFLFFRFHVGFSGKMYDPCNSSRPLK